jgi:hypothetical protein
VANRAMELMGDHGYLATQGAEKAMRDVRLNQIYEGTSQINYLAFIESFWESDIARAEVVKSLDRSSSQSGRNNAKT